MPFGLPLVRLLAAVLAAVVPTLRAEITRAAGPSAELVTLQVHLRPTDLVLGSYQGSLRWKPGSLSIVSVSAPGKDGTRMFNAADSAKGIVRFAGFSTSGFTGTDALTLVVKPVRPLERAGLTVAVDVAGDLAGKAVPKDRLIPARGVRGGQ